MLLDKTERIYESKKDSYLARRTKKRQQRTHTIYIFFLSKRNYQTYLFKSVSKRFTTELAKKCFFANKKLLSTISLKLLG